MIRGAGGGGVHVRRHNRRKPAHSIPQAVLMHRLEVSGATVCLGEGGRHVCSVQAGAGGRDTSLDSARKHALQTRPGRRGKDAGSWFSLQLGFVTELGNKRRGDSEAGPFSAGE